MLEQVSIRDHWDFARQGLEEIKRVRGGAWIPEDIYADCVNGKAFFWMAEEGFIIFKAVRDEYESESKLLIWAAWGPPEVDMDQKYMPQIKSIAKEHGFRRLQFYRPPKSLVTSGGWRKITTIYEMEVAP